MGNNIVPPGFVLPLWPLIERLLIISHHIRPLCPHSNCIISLELKKYSGHTITLDDNCQIKTGDPILELHMNNVWFKMKRDLNIKISASPYEVLSCFRQYLHLLAELMMNAKYRHIVALHGSTFLGLGAKRLGFQVENLPNTLWKKWAQFYLIGIMKVYYIRTGSGPDITTKSWELKDVWFSRTAFLRRYGNEGDSYREGPV